MKGSAAPSPRVAALSAILDSHRAQYVDLAGAADFGEYATSKAVREDEQLLTEPILTQILRDVLGFPTDGYYPQYGRGGLKPDLTPMDPIAHPFVLDAKSSLQNLASHEDQIRRYIDQRQLDFGVLFNLREIRTYRRGKNGHDPSLSFALAPLWAFGRGATMAPPELDQFDGFVDQFSHRELSFDDRVASISAKEAWQARDPDEVVEIDVDFLVEKLRALSKLLASDAESQESDLLAQLALNPALEQTILRELEVLAVDLAPGTSPESLPDAVGGFTEAEGLPLRTWKQYLLRVSQLALARILLYRSWEDAGFVASYLYDGGFEQMYERFGRSARGVLDDAFAQGGKAYRWLYGSDSNYDWYRPSDEPLVEVLYSLTPFPLGKLDADVLGGLYESYVDEIDRDRLGQFFTPRSVVRFMLSRAGMEGPDGVFRVEGDEREAVKLLDFATGSGGFLVEAARRIVDEVGTSADPKSLNEALRAIVIGLHGSEISPFPYYLTEINLLLQVSRVLGALRAEGHRTPAFALSVVHADTLTARGSHAASIEGLDAELKADRSDLVGDSAFQLVPLDAEKQAAFRRIREDDAFDLVVGNPPYVFEANNRLLFERLRALSAWSGDYRGKSDLLYYFLALAAEKVRQGGRLCVITPAGWMNAGNAEWLRSKLAGSLRLDELFLFGSYRLFAPEHEIAGRRYAAPTPTVESAILIATKAEVTKGHKLRVVALENERAAAETLGRLAGDASPDRDLLLGEMAQRFGGRQGRKGGIQVHDVEQSKLDHSVPWPIKHSPKDVASKVVAHLDKRLKSGELERLDERWDIPQGIQTGADAYSARIQRRLKNEFPKAYAALEAMGASTGAPIMELPAGAEGEPPWSSSPHLLAKSIEPTAILYGAMDEGDSTSLVWIGREDEVPSEVIDALEPWKAVLASRAEIVRNSSRRWFETTWPRSKLMLRRPKVIALYRTDRGRFALDETGEWQPSIKTTLVIPKQEGTSVAYLCGLLSSELLDLWYAVRGKTPWHVRRNYEPKPMARIPYRHAEPSAGTAAGLDELRSAIAASEAGSLFTAAQKLAASGEDGLMAAAVELLVRVIADNRRALLPYRELDPELARIVKDPWRVGPVEIDEARAIAALPDSLRLSVRLDPGLDATFHTDGVLGRAKLESGELIFRHARSITVQLTGPPDRLALLLMLVGTNTKLLPKDLLTLALPKDLAAFADHVAEQAARIYALLELGRSAVESVERLVCRLYGLPAKLEDEVVAAAVARASAG